MKEFLNRMKQNMLMVFVCLLVAWLMPQNLFSDCIHAVLPKEIGGEHSSLEQVYKDGFLPENSELKIVWKFIGNN